MILEKVCLNFLSLYLNTRNFLANFINIYLVQDIYTWCSYWLINTSRMSESYEVIGMKIPNMLKTWNLRVINPYINPKRKN